MIYLLCVPGPADDMSEMRVLQWHAVPGAPVTQGQLVVELETHKAIVEVRADQSAVLRQILCPEGEWGEPGRALAVLSDAGDEPLPEGETIPLAATFEIC